MGFKFLKIFKVIHTADLVVNPATELPHWEYFLSFFFACLIWFQVWQEHTWDWSIAVWTLWSCVSSKAVSHVQPKRWEKWLSSPRVSQDSSIWISMIRWEAWILLLDLPLFAPVCRFFFVFVFFSISSSPQPLILFTGNFVEVRRDWGLNHHDGTSDEQRRDPYLLRADLHDARVPQESQETLLSNVGAKVWVLSQVQRAGAGRQRHGTVSGCHYPQRG